MVSIVVLPPPPYYFIDQSRTLSHEQILYLTSQPRVQVVNMSWKPSHFWVVKHQRQTELQNAWLTICIHLFSSKCAWFCFIPILFHRFKDLWINYIYKLSNAWFHRFNFLHPKDLFLIYLPGMFVVGPADPFTCAESSKYDEYHLRTITTNIIQIYATTTGTTDTTGMFGGHISVGNNFIYVLGGHAFFYFTCS